MNLHQFTSVEIPAAAYGSVKQRLLTLAGTTTRRVALFRRDRLIARELHHGWRPLAERYGLSKGAVYLAAKRGKGA